MYFLSSDHLRHYSSHFINRFEARGENQHVAECLCLASGLCKHLCSIWWGGIMYDPHLALRAAASVGLVKLTPQSHVVNLSQNESRIQPLPPKLWCISKSKFSMIRSYLKILLNWNCLKCPEIWHWAFGVALFPAGHLGIWASGRHPGPGLSWSKELMLTVTTRLCMARSRPSSEL